MRIIITTIIILFLIISGSVTSYNYISSTSRNLVSQLQNAEKAIQNQKWAVAQGQLEQIQNNWHKTKYWWTILLNHHEIDNIELSSQRLKQYLMNQDKTLSLAEISALEMLYEHIADTEALTIENIL
jgi:signal transduction histidine kinase